MPQTLALQIILFHKVILKARVIVTLHKIKNKLFLYPTKRNDQFNNNNGTIEELYLVNKT